MARLRVTLAFTALLFPALALADPAPIRLIAPVAGAALRGGSTAAISWEADSLPSEAEEWEAFLSIDGGRHYAIRITPHLDIDIRRVTWTVPNIIARDVRMLLRFGDERHESAIEVPVSFAIEGTFNGAALWPAAISSPSLGEEAREGDGGVTAWVAGDRDGKRSHLVPTAPPPAVHDTTVHSQPANGDHVATLPRPSLATPQECTLLILRIARPRPEPAPAANATPDILLVSSRLNI